jgi:hypothetical protein
MKLAENRQGAILVEMELRGRTNRSKRLVLVALALLVVRLER